MKIEEIEDEYEKNDKDLEAALKLLKTYVKARDEGIASKNPELEALLDVMEQQQESSSGNITLPKVGTDRAQSETIVPKPFFVIKTTTYKNEKIFINICGSPKIPPPAEWEQGIPTDVEEAIKVTNDSESMIDIPNVHFPVSCADPVTSTDHGGKPCRVFDMVYNSSIIQFTMTNKKMKLFFIEMATTWISQKYHLELDSDFKLPNMKYKGSDVASQQIRATPTGPLVSELSSDLNFEPSFPLLTTPQIPKTHAPKPNNMSTSAPINFPGRFTTQASHTTDNSWKKTSQEFDERLTEGYGTTALNWNQSSRVVPSSKVRSSDIRSLSYQNSNNQDKTTCNGATKLEEMQKFSYEDKILGEPRIEFEYSSRPVDVVFVMIFFPQLKLENLEVLVTYNHLLIKSSSHESIEVLLPFCSKLQATNALYDFSTRLLTLKLPYLSYSEALNRIHCSSSMRSCN